MNHTPAPWTHASQGGITGMEDNGSGRGMVDVCAVYLRTVPGRFEANARLIAAAPELLAALKEAYKYINGGSERQSGLAFHALFNQVRAAIKKAEGV